MLRELLVEEFELLGGKCFAAENGNEAYAIYQQEHAGISWVLSDIRMPECSGIELAEKIKKSGLTQPIIALMTGYSDQDHKSPDDLFADALFSKPFQLSKIIEFFFEFPSSRCPK